MNKYYLRSYITSIFSIFIVALSFFIPFLQNREFPKNKKSLFEDVMLLQSKIMRLQEKINLLQSQIEMDTPFHPKILSAYLHFSKQQKNELNVIYKKYQKNLFTSKNINTRYWHWLNLIEEIQKMLTEKQKLHFQKLLLDN